MNQNCLGQIPTIYYESNAVKLFFDKKLVYK